MKKVQNVIPVFYARCVNAPYTEGHIQMIRMLTKSLLLYNIKSIIFNFKYGVNRLTFEDSYVSKHRIEQYIPLVTRDSLYKFSAPTAAYALSMETLKTLRFFLLEKTLKSKGCVVNIVNCSRYPRMFLRRLSRAPIILHFYMPNIRLRPMTRMLAKKANLIIASSYTLSQYLEELGVSKEKIRVVYPPIDTELYQPLRKEWARIKLGLPTRARIIMYIGGLKRTRFPEEEMLKVIKKLVKEIPEVMLLVFTPKDSENIKRVPKILRKIKQAHLMQTIKIRAKDLTDTEKTLVYSAADVFLFPCFVTRTAIQPPLTVLEAMASGAVVVAPKIPLLSEIIIDNNNGFLFSNSDYDNLADRLADVLVDTDRKIAVSKRARQTIEQKASLLTTGAKVAEIHRNLLSGDKV
jgi:glycosyltransferase involved in cell wall biosynthesis